jgi:hypothetical protein
MGLWLQATTLNVLNNAALVSTLVALVWYTFETRGLRLQQEFDSEIRNHPWLKGSDLRPNWVKDHGGMLGRDIVYLPITNVGITPAHDVCIELKWTVTSKKSKSGQNKITGLVLAPSDTGHIKLCEIDKEAPDERTGIDVEISYRSFTGGGGRLEMNFVREPGKGWTNGPMSHEFWLADGRRYPPVAKSQ